mmetsp:Transcript_32476/g.103249  ORF Transcript_32476/g.103249 Transcript_32476/m.103249 type:complete len:258 (-) Transcript_32476:23-796(-)
MGRRTVYCGCKGSSWSWFFSLDRVFVVLLIFLTLETPRRLMSKALFVSMFGSLAVRWLFISGLAPLLECLRIIPYALGIWMVYCGTRLIALHDDTEGVSDVTQSSVVCVLRSIFGGRLGEFYDEESECVFVQAKQKCCVTLLGVALLSILFMDGLISLDVALLKQEQIQNAFLDITSAASAFFVIRALFFVVRDVVNIFGLAKYSLGAVFFFLGSQMLLGRMVYISAAVSASVVLLIVAISASVSWFHAGPNFKFLV